MSALTETIKELTKTGIEKLIEGVRLDLLIPKFHERNKLHPKGVGAAITLNMAVATACYGLGVDEDTYSALLLGGFIYPAIAAGITSVLAERVYQPIKRIYSNNKERSDKVDALEREIQDYYENGNL